MTNDSKSIFEGRAKDFNVDMPIPVAYGGGDIVADKKVISKAMSAFDRVAQKAASRVSNEFIHEARTNSEFREAIATKEVQYTAPGIDVYGVQKDKYAVFPMPVNDKTRYSVVDMSASKTLVEGLSLNASADSIVKLLNKNYSFYSPEVKNILVLEEKYNKHYNDAMSFKRKSGNKESDAIRESRFEEAKHKLLTIKEEILKTNKRLI